MSDDLAFNRGALMNIGYHIAMSDIKAETEKMQGGNDSSQFYDWECLVFHDMDMLPMDPANTYSCGNLVGMLNE